MTNKKFNVILNGMEGISVGSNPKPCRIEVLDHESGQIQDMVLQTVRVRHRLLKVGKHSTKPRRRQFRTDILWFRGEVKLDDGQRRLVKGVYFPRVPSAQFRYA